MTDKSLRDRDLGVFGSQLVRNFNAAYSIVEQKLRESEMTVTSSGAGINGAAAKLEIPPFPQYQAAALAAAARQVGVPGVRAAVDLVSRMPGSPDAVERVMYTWIDANAHLRSATDGSAAGDQLILGQLIDEMGKLREQLVRYYACAIERINESANTVIGLAGDLGGSVVSRDLSGTANAMAGALASFTDSVRTLVTDVIDYVNGTQERVVNIRRSAGIVEVPAQFAASTFAYRNWTPVWRHGREF